MKYFRLKIVVCLVALALITAILLSGSLRVEGDYHQNHLPYYVLEIDSCEEFVELMAAAETAITEDSAQDVEDKRPDQGLIIAINIAVILIIITGTVIFVKRRKTKQD